MANMPGSDVADLRIHGLTSISDGRVQEAGGISLFQDLFLDSLIRVRQAYVCLCESGYTQDIVLATDWLKYVCLSNPSRTDICMPV